MYLKRVIKPYFFMPLKCVVFACFGPVWDILWNPNIGKICIKLKHITHDYFWVQYHTVQGEKVVQTG